MTDIQKTLSERKEKYGDFRDHAQLSTDLKMIMRCGNSWMETSPYMKEALEMIQHKIARILNGDPTYEDSWVDIIGYAQLALDRLRQDNENYKTIAAFGEQKREGSPVAYTNYAPPEVNHSQTVVQSATIGIPSGGIVSSTTPDRTSW